MSWHFSNRLIQDYENSRRSQVVVAGSLVENSSDSEPSALWRSTPFAPDDSCSDKLKDTCHRTPFGQLFVTSTDDHGADLLMWYRADFLAKMSPLPATELESPEKSPDSGRSLHGLFAMWDRDTCSWKIP